MHMPSKEAAQLRFDSIEDSIEAFSMFPTPVYSIFSLLHTIFIVVPRSTYIQITKILRTVAYGRCTLAGRGEFIVVLDSQDRENEGDLIIAAEDVTTEKMSFMVRHTRYCNPPILAVRSHRAGRLQTHAFPAVSSVPPPLPHGQNL